MNSKKVAAVPAPLPPALASCPTVLSAESTPPVVAARVPPPPPPKAPPLVVALGKCRVTTLGQASNEAATDGLVYAVRAWLNDDGPMGLSDAWGVDYLSVGFLNFMSNGGTPDAAEVACAARMPWLLEYTKAALQSHADHPAVEPIFCEKAICCFKVGGHDPYTEVMRFRHRRTGGWELTAYESTASRVFEEQVRSQLALTNRLRAGLRNKRCGALPNYRRLYDYPRSW